MLLKNKYKKTYKKAWNGIPATIKRVPNQKSLYDSFFASIFWHIIAILLIWALVTTLAFFGITNKVFPTPKEKIKDIEFNINNKSGHSARHKSQNISKTTAQNSEPVNNVIPEQKNVMNDIAPQKNNNSTKKYMGKTIKHSNNSVPDFSMPVPDLNSLSSGLGNSNNHHNSGNSGNSGSQINDINSAFSSANGSGVGSGSGSSTGFNKNTTKKIIAVYDISPYANELKRNVRWNWKPPTGSENKKVELFMRIARDGRLIILNVKRTSETGNVDEAALNAVKKCSPLDPLPSKYTKNYLDIIFSFSGNTITSRY